MPDRLSQQDLEAYLWGAAVILRGLVDAGDYKQFIFPLLFYKRLSDMWDKEYAATLAETGDEDYARAPADDPGELPGGRDPRGDFGYATLFGRHGHCLSHHQREGSAHGFLPYCL